MNRTTKFLFTAQCLLLLAAAVGCESLTHELQPHRLWRLNRTRAMGNDAYFSVSDTVTNGVRERVPSHDVAPSSPPSFTADDTPKASANPDARVE